MNDRETIDAVLTRLRAGVSRVDVLMELMASGSSREEASSIVSKANAELRNERQHKRKIGGNFKMLAGASLLLIGIGTMVYTYMNSSSTLLLPIGILAMGGYLIIFAGMSRV